MSVYYEDQRIRVHKVICGPYDNNAYIVADPRAKEGVVIDAPTEAEKLLQELGDIKAKALILTHTHFDHILGLREMVQGLQAPVACHTADADKLPSHPDIAIKDGDTMQVGGLELRFLHTPGHTPGGVCIHVGKHLFSGDTLFPGGPGKTRSPEDFKQVVESITGKLLVLPEDVEVYPGHGDNATIKQAKEEYQAFASRSHPEDLCGDVLWLKS